MQVCYQCWQDLDGWQEKQVSINKKDKNKIIFPLEALSSLWKYIYLDAMVMGKTFNEKFMGIFNRIMKFDNLKKYSIIQLQVEFIRNVISLDIRGWTFPRDKHELKKSYDLVQIILGLICHYSCIFAKTDLIISHLLIEQ